MAQTVRLLPRLILSFVFFLLPLTSEDQVSSTQIVSIGAGLMLFVGAWEIFGSLERGASLFESWNIPKVEDQEDEEVPIFQTQDGRRDYETFDDNS